MPAAAALKVFLVDDQVSMRVLIRQALQAIGIRHIREQSSAEAALPELQAERANLILSDHNMKGMSGLDFLSAIRADPNLAKTPFIMLTGAADREVVTKAIALGVNNYIVKPFTTAVLKQKIEQCFGSLT